MTRLTNTNNTNVDSAKITDSIKVRGIAAAIQSMSFPSFKNLDELLNKVGYKLIPINRTTDSNQNSNQLQ